MASEVLKSVWSRPSLIIFSTKPPTQDGTKWDFDGGSVLYLTDDNRSPLAISPERIETKKRMIDGTMRSVYVADKNTFSTSWQDIPSRSKDTSREYISEYERSSVFTSGFGAGIDIKTWYESNTDDFWMLLVYDISASSSVNTNAELYNVFFESFNYEVSKRGTYNDLWNVDISLVEV